MQFSEGAAQAQLKHQKLLAHLEAQKKARELVLPTDDNLVQLRLRELSEPIKLFGESKAARRERLRTYLAEHGITQGMPGEASEQASVQLQQAAQQPQKAAASNPVDRLKEQFFYPGDPYLKDVRKQLIASSLARADKRLCVARGRRDESNQAIARGVPDSFTLEYAQVAERLKRYQNSSSDIGSTRPLSSCAFEGRNLAISDWLGAIKLFNHDGKCIWQVVDAHEDRAQHVAWISQGRLLSCGADNMVKLWDCTLREASFESIVEAKSALVSKFAGHTARVNRVCVHPNSNLFMSTSYDGTWRLWDVNRPAPLGTMEGHIGAVYGISAQIDGSLVASTGLDGLCRIWDLRTGRAIAAFRGHVKMALTVDFSPDGYRLVTGADDNSIRVWDLRRQASVYTIAAHTSTVSHVKYFAGGEMMVSTSFDNTLRVWGMRDHACLNTLAGHDSRITYCDIDSDLNIASVAFDKTIKRWTASLI